MYEKFGKWPDAYALMTSKGVVQQGSDGHIADQIRPQASKLVVIVDDADEDVLCYQDLEVALCFATTFDLENNGNLCGRICRSNST